MPRLTPRVTRSSATARSASSKSPRAQSATTAQTTASTAPARTPVADKLRDELREIGTRRATLTAEVAELEADTGKSISRAKGKLGMTEVAKLLGLHRTSLYRTYGA